MCLASKLDLMDHLLNTRVRMQINKSGCHELTKVVNIA
jgi:hypothetical protein